MGTAADLSTREMRTAVVVCIVCLVYEHTSYNIAHPTILCFDGDRFSLIMSRCPAIYMVFKRGVHTYQMLYVQIQIELFILVLF